ncbi:MAG: hypothetical protein NTW29_13245 [Bacteroidetes bacterium]|nr:hypothetical protein [Bacteroidota bacterium]
MKEILNSYLVPLGVVLTFIASLFGIFYTRRIARSTKYIDTITSERIKWNEKVRDEVSELNSIFLTIIKNTHIITELEDSEEKTINPFTLIDISVAQNKLNKEIDSFSKTEILKKLITLRLRFNPNEHQSILSCIYELTSFTLGQKQTKESIQKIWEINNKLIEEAQIILKSEWEKIKKEVIVL